MSFTATPTDGSATPIPMSSVVPDGTNTPLALEGGPSISTGGNTLAPASMYIKDGNDVTKGSTTDAAVTGDTNGTISAKLRGLSKILANVWNSAVNSLNVSWVVASTGGSTPYHNISAATTNFTNVKAAACQLYGYAVTNTSASEIYVKFYNLTTVPTSASTVTHSIGVPANSVVIIAIPEGLKFGTGFGWGATANAADNDNTAIAANCIIDFRLSN